MSFVNNQIEQDIVIGKDEWNFTLIQMSVPLVIARKKCKMTALFRQMTAFLASKFLSITLLATPCNTKNTMENALSLKISKKKTVHIPHKFNTLML